MKKVKATDAIGMTLCHDITAMYDGLKALPLNVVM